MLQRVSLTLVLSAPRTTIHNVNCLGATEWHSLKSLAARALHSRSTIHHQETMGKHLLLVLTCRAETRPNRKLWGLVPTLWVRTTAVDAFPPKAERVMRMTRPSLIHVARGQKNVHLAKLKLKMIQNLKMINYWEK